MVKNLQQWFCKLLFKNSNLPVDQDQGFMILGEAFLVRVSSLFKKQLNMDLYPFKNQFPVYEKPVFILKQIWRDTYISLPWFFRGAMY